MDRGKAVGFVGFVQDHWIDVCVIASTSCIAGFGFLASDEGIRLGAGLFNLDVPAFTIYQPVFFRLLIISIALLAGIQIVAAKRARKVSRLQLERDQLCLENRGMIEDLKAFARAFLKWIAENRLNFKTGPDG